VVAAKAVALGHDDAMIKEGERERRREGEKEKEA
jgi:hypothetical protein